MFCLQQWDENLAAFAQEYAENCTFAHSRSADRMNLVDGVSWVGENLYITSAQFYEGVTKDAIEAWYNEKSDYDYESNTCTPGRVCGHYTQVIHEIKIHKLLVHNYYVIGGLGKIISSWMWSS